MNYLVYYIYPVYVLVFLLIGLFVFYKLIYTPHVVKSAQLTFSDLLTAMNAVINTELDIYEKNIFATRGAITNANFDNYYKDITDKILFALSPTFYFHMSIYLTEDAVATIVCRKVKEYLTTKINGTV